MKSTPDILHAENIVWSNFAAAVFARAILHPLNTQSENVASLNEIFSKSQFLNWHDSNALPSNAKLLSSFSREKMKR